MVTNIFASLNYIFKDARRLLICSLTKFYRDKLQMFFCDRHVAVQSTFTQLVKWGECQLKGRLNLIIKILQFSCLNFGKILVLCCHMKYLNRIFYMRK